MVFYSIEHDKALDDLTMDEFKEFSDIIDDDIYNAISMETCVNDRKVIGGPAKEVVEKAIADAKRIFSTAIKTKCKLLNQLAFFINLL